MKENDKAAMRAAKDIVRVELYLLFVTDGDFWVHPDGLKSFIISRLGSNVIQFRFRVAEIPLGHWDGIQLIRLSVERPEAIRGKDGHIPGTNCFYHPDAWAEEAIEQVLLPAYMWIFAEIGIGNRHGLSFYFSPDVFGVVGVECPIYHWSKSEFTDGVMVLPLVETMSGNYSGSWAQFRFVLNDAKDNGDPTEYVNETIRDLDEEWK